jgi:predicted DNA-binding transcriptional regulator AlpA
MHPKPAQQIFYTSLRPRMAAANTERRFPLSPRRRTETSALVRGKTPTTPEAAYHQRIAWMPGRRSPARGSNSSRHNAKAEMRNAADQLPPSLPPRGLSRSEAAAYLGISASLFDELVKDGRMPPPKRINSRTVWDRKRLDEAFEALPGGDSDNPWGDAAA